METKLQELTQKIYNEGVEKAKIEAKVILENANNEADTIINNAKKEASSILANAKNDSTQLSNKTISELNLVRDQILSILKQAITELISSKALSEKIKEVINDTEFIKEIIKEIFTKWDPKQDNLSLNLILSAKSKEKLLEYYKKESKEILNKGIEIKFEERMNNGFKIISKDGSFIISFTDDDFIKFFQSFLKPNTKTILFS